MLHQSVGDVFYAGIWNGKGSKAAGADTSLALSSSFPFRDSRWPSRFSRFFTCTTTRARKLLLPIVRAPKLFVQVTSNGHECQICEFMQYIINVWAYVEYRVGFIVTPRSFIFSIMWSICHKVLVKELLISTLWPIRIRIHHHWIKLDLPLRWYLRPWTLFTTTSGTSSTFKVRWTANRTLRSVGAALRTPLFTTGATRGKNTYLYRTFISGSVIEQCVGAGERWMTCGYDG